jgi:hypothetical protein
MRYNAPHQRKSALVAGTLSDCMRLLCDTETCMKYNHNASKAETECI